jgi:hypothetical protein
VIVPHNPYEPLTDEHRAALKAAWPNAARLSAAWRLARDLHTLEQLLRGEPVHRDRLDPEWLAWASARDFVTLGPLFYFDDEEPVAA